MAQPPPPFKGLMGLRVSAQLDFDIEVKAWFCSPGPPPMSVCSLKLYVDLIGAAAPFQESCPPPGLPLLLY